MADEGAGLVVGVCILAFEVAGQGGLGVVVGPAAGSARRAADRLAPGTRSRPSTRSSAADGTPVAPMGPWLRGQARETPGHQPRRKPVEPVAQVARSPGRSSYTSRAAPNRPVSSSRECKQQPGQRIPGARDKHLADALTQQPSPINARSPSMGTGGQQHRTAACAPASSSPDAPSLACISALSPASQAKVASPRTVASPPSGQAATADTTCAKLGVNLRLANCGEEALSWPPKLGRSYRSKGASSPEHTPRPS